MNNKLTMAVVPMILFAVMLVSCKKEKDEGGRNGITGRYKMTGLTKVEPGGETDQFPLIDDCVKDDVLEFRSDKTYVYTDAGSICVPNGSETGTWENMGGNKIKIDAAEVTIVSQTATQLVLLRIQPAVDGDLVFKAVYRKL